MTLKLSGVCLSLLLLSAGIGHAQEGSAAAPPASGAPADAAPAESAAPGAAPPAAVSQAPAPSGAIGAPPSGKGQVVFFRKSALQGALIWFKVRENGTELGKLTPGKYFVVTAEPGVHTYTAATENTDKLRLEIEPGETYYVEGKITMGVLVGRANLSPTDQASFDKVSTKLKLANPPAETVSHPASSPPSSNAPPAS